MFLLCRVRVKMTLGLFHRVCWPCCYHSMPRLLGPSKRKRSSGIRGGRGGPLGRPLEHIHHLILSVSLLILRGSRLRTGADWRHILMGESFPYITETFPTDPLRSFESALWLSGRVKPACSRAK